jgi:hypothetical protein
MFENQIREETAQLGKELGAKITVGHEGMRLKL